MIILYSLYQPEYQSNLLSLIHFIKRCSTYLTICISRMHDRRRISSKTFSRPASSRCETAIRLSRLLTADPHYKTVLLELLSTVHFEPFLDNHLFFIFITLSKVNRPESTVSNPFDKRIVVHDRIQNV